MPRGGARAGAGRPKDQPKGQRTLNLDGTVGGLYNKKNYQPAKPAIAVEESRKRDREKEEEEANKKSREEDGTEDEAANEEEKDEDRVILVEEANEVTQRRLETQSREEAEQRTGFDVLQKAREIAIENRHVGVADGGGGGGGGGDGDDDNEDYFSDDDCDTDDEDTPADAETTKNRKRDKCKPPRGSILDTCLTNFKAKTTKETNLQQLKGKTWFPPECGAIERNVDPSHFYLTHPFIYLFDPFNSRRLPADKKHMKDYCCPHCKKTGCLESNGWYYRPQHCFEKIACVLHQRLACRKDKCKNGCGQTFAAFSPNFMGQFPTVIVESFPFLHHRKPFCLFPRVRQLLTKLVLAKGAI